MSPQFQTASRYLLEHPQDVAVESMRTIAGSAGVQPATMVRLAQSLGFTGWSQLRSTFVEQFRLQPEPYAIRARSLIDRAEPRSLIAETFRAQRANLEHTEVQDTDTLLQAASLLNMGKTIHVAGFRACYPIAFTFHYLYRFFRPSVYLLNGVAGLLEMQLRAINRDDTTVVISFAPYSQEIRMVTKAAQAAGSRIVAITDSVVAPIALVADVTILFPVTSPSFFPSIVAGIGLCETLIELLVSQGGEGVVAQIEHSERQLHDTRAYDAPVQKGRKPR
jgi:DNA-binding MurR/RpiR family transcriptional regulator